MNTPHRITVAETEEYLANRLVEFANALTADGTQHKQARRRGTGTYIISRRYVVENVWQTVYEGPDIEEAVRMYNGLG